MGRMQLSTTWENFVQPCFFEDVEQKDIEASFVGCFEECTGCRVSLQLEQVAREDQQRINRFSRLRPDCEPSAFLYFTVFRVLCMRLMIPTTFISCFDEEPSESWRRFSQCLVFILQCAQLHEIAFVSLSCVFQLSLEDLP